MTPSIRRLGPGDAAAWHALRLDGLVRHPDCFGAAADEHRGLSEAEIVRRMEENHIFGAFDAAGRLCGCMALEVLCGAKERHKGYIWAAYVLPEARGRGLGSALLDRVIAEARGLVTDLRLSVAAHNAGARQLYERAGFARYGCEPRALMVDGRPVDEILMALRLDGRDSDPPA